MVDLGELVHPSHVFVEAAESTLDRLLAFVTSRAHIDWGGPCTVRDFAKDVDLASP